MRRLIQNPVLCVFWLLAVLFVWSPMSTAHAQEAKVVIKKRPFPKKNKVEIGVFGGWIPSNPFVTYAPVEARIGFHAAEGFGLEITGGLYPGSIGRSPLKNTINDDLKRFPHFLGVKLFEQQVFYANLNLNWTPVYGKFRFAGLNWVGYWEMFFQLGGGVTGVYNEEFVGRKANADLNPIQMRPTFNVGAGFRIWFTHWMNLRFDVREYLFQKQIGRGGLSQHLSIMMGLSFLIG